MVAVLDSQLHWCQQRNWDSFDWKKLLKWVQAISTWVTLQNGYRARICSFHRPQPRFPRTRLWSHRPHRPDHRSHHHLQLPHHHPRPPHHHHQPDSRSPLPSADRRRCLQSWESLGLGPRWTSRLKVSSGFTRLQWKYLTNSRAKSGPGQPSCVSVLLFLPPCLRFDDKIFAILHYCSGLGVLRSLKVKQSGVKLQTRSSKMNGALVFKYSS